MLPKGWAEPDLAPHELAAKEAFEEAGLVGEIEPEPVGYYSYDKRLRGGRSVSCQVSVFPMWVGRQLKHWPENGQRETRWLTHGQAAMAVDEGDLVPSSCAWQRPRNDARQIALSSAPKTVADRGHAKPDRLARRALLLQGIRSTVVPVER